MYKIEQENSIKQCKLTFKCFHSLLLIVPLITILTEQPSLAMEENDNHHASRTVNTASSADSREDEEKTQEEAEPSLISKAVAWVAEDPQRALGTVTGIATSLYGVVSWFLGGSAPPPNTRPEPPIIIDLMGSGNAPIPRTPNLGPSFLPDQLVMPIRKF